eukprot:snap_masked-scaffold_12-processed-gene-1.36-mRNA-1 protein AED:1.00 eAED:1.00 QI:0/0/0/0/1/1/2/0/59
MSEATKNTFHLRSNFEDDNCHTDQWPLDSFHTIKKERKAFGVGDCSKQIPPGYCNSGMG